MRIALRRLALFVTLPPGLLALLSIYWNITGTERAPDYVPAAALLTWCAFAWGIYWVVSPLTRPARPDLEAGGQDSGA